MKDRDGNIRESRRNVGKAENNDYIRRWRMMSEKRKECRGTKKMSDGCRVDVGEGRI